MLAEIGELAAAEARPHSGNQSDWLQSLLFEEPSPPGRDVWSGFSPVTGRLVQLIYFTDRRSSILRDRLLPTLVDHPRGRATPWAVFDLTLFAPAEASLIGHRFNAGDLALRFDGPVGQWSARQIAPASLAIGRQSLANWVTTPPPAIGAADSYLSRFYRLDAVPTDTAMSTVARSLWRRRRRFFWRADLLPNRVVLGHVDSARDRILILEGSDEALLGEILGSMGSSL